MPDKPGHSAFIPLIVMGMVVLIGLFLALVPLVDCSHCPTLIAQQISQATESGSCGIVLLPPDSVSDLDEHAPDEPEMIPCPACGDTGKVPLLNIWPKE